MSLRRSAIRFALMSGVSFVVNFGLTMLLHEVIGAPAEVAFAVALVTVFVMNFFAMRHFVYSGREGSVGRQLIVFAGSSVGFRGAEYVAFIVVHTWLDLDYRIALIGILGTSAAIKFVYYRMVFERRRGAGPGIGA